MHSHLPLRTIDTCRVCGSPELAPILSLGSIFVSDFVTDRTIPSPDERYPLELVLCDPEKGGRFIVPLPQVKILPPLKTKSRAPKT